MKKITGIFLLLLFLVSCGSVEKYNKQISELHTVSELHEDIDKTYIRLKRAHPRLYQYISKEQLDFKFDSLKQSINTPISSKEFYTKIAPVIKTIGQGHIGVAPPTLKRTKAERKAYRDKKFGFNSLGFESVENRLYVIRAKDKDTLLIGAEVLKVEDETPGELIESYNRNIASDGYNTTLFDRIIGSRFTKYYRRDKGFLDSLQVTFQKRDSVFIKMFRWEDTMAKKDSLSAATKDSLSKVPVKLSKEVIRFKKDSIKSLRKYRKIHGYDFENDVYNRNLSFIGKDSAVAYMQIRSFTIGNFKKFCEQAFTTIDSLKTKSLIIDLRDNTGGRVKEINELYGYLTNKEYIMYNPSEVTGRTPLMKMAMSNTSSGFLKGLAIVFSPVIGVFSQFKTTKRDGVLYYNLNGVKPLKPKEKNFTGKLYVLINGSSFSASSLLSTNLKKQTELRLLDRKQVVPTTEP